MSTPNETRGDGLWRWLLGGLLGGVAILGLVIVAYVIGYHRAQDHAKSVADSKPVSTNPSATPNTTPKPAAIGTVTVTPALVTRGKALYGADGCSGCHSLTGAAGAGPTFQGLAGGTSTLDSGQSVKTDDAYLERSILQPDAQIVKGYRPGLMSSAIAGFDLAHKPDDIRALVAFIKSEK